MFRNSDLVMHSIQRQGMIAVIADFPVSSLGVEDCSHVTGWAPSGGALSSGAALILAWAVAGVEQSVGRVVTLGTGALMSRILLVEMSQKDVAPVAVYESVALYLSVGIEEREEDVNWRSEGLAPRQQQCTPLPHSLKSSEPART